MQFCLLFENRGEQEQAVSQRARHHDGIEASELVRDEIVIGDAAFVSKVFGVGAGMERPDRNDKAEAISRRYFTATPRLYEWNAVLCGNQAGVRFGQSLVSDEVLIHPGKPGP